MYTKYKSVGSVKQQTISTHYKAEISISLGNIYISGSGETENRMLYLVHTDQTLNTVEKYNAWLKAQYDSGKPVIVYYATEEPLPFEERPAYQAYEPIPNEGGVVDIIDSGPYPPFEINYIKHS